MASGGYRQPSQPAAVSGPGALSQRTDRGQPVRAMTGGDYGDNQDMATLQQGAPMAKAQPLPSGPTGGSGGPSLVGLGDPTQEPGTPVTAGAAVGAGPGTEALGLPTDRVGQDRQDAAQLASVLPAMIAAAQAEDATPSFKRFVRELIANS